MFDILKKLYDEATSEYIRGRIREIAQYEFNRIFHADGSLTEEEIRLGTQQGKIAAIREYRSRTGLGLKEAKDAVEDYFLRKGLKFLQR